MRKEKKYNIIFYTILAVIMVVLFLIGPLQIGVQRASAQSYFTLKVRVRYSDGSPAEGIKVELNRQDLGLPDIYEGDCLVPKSGFCEFTVEKDLTYIVKFPGSPRLDPITEFAAGHQGINGMGIILREKDHTIGFVLSKLVDEEVDANWMLLDLKPEEEIPLPRIPNGAVAEAQKILDEAKPVETFPTVTPVPTVEQIQISAPTIAAPEVVEPEEDELEAIAVSEIELIDEEDVQLENETASEGVIEETQESESDSGTGLILILVILVLALILIVGWIVITWRGMQTSGGGK